MDKMESHDSVTIALVRYEASVGMSAANMPSSLIDSGRNVWAHARAIDRAIFAFLALFALALPFSIKGAERAWKIAIVLWLAKLVWDRVRPIQQPLVAPL